MAESITIESIRIEPPNPGAETLCRLFVTLKNGGEHTASLFAFTVEVGGEALEVYKQELHVYPLPAGAREELRLFNFWTTESGRSAPKDGRLKVEVRLEEARWVHIEQKGDDEEIWTPGEVVPGLPSAGHLVVELGAGLDPSRVGVGGGGGGGGGG